MELEYRGTTKIIIDKGNPLYEANLNKQKILGLHQHDIWFGGINEYSQYDVINVLNEEHKNIEVKLTLTQLEKSEYYEIWKELINSKQK